MSGYTSIVNGVDPVDDDAPHGWIQYKGTDICIDLHCVCGTHGHYDGYQAYTVRCEDCGRHYALTQRVLLVELDDEQTARLKAGADGGVWKFQPFRDDDD